MVDKSTDAGMVGPFWVVEADGQAAIIALAVPLEQADVYGGMLTVDTGHLDYWSALARRGTRALREAGLPTAPIWSGTRNGLGVACSTIAWRSVS
jgi:hypothetical protein